MNPEIIPVPCLQDNYAYLVICPKTRSVAVVDPSEAAPILEALDKKRLSLSAIWNTHHHWDHVGGNTTLLRHFSGLRVYGHQSDQGRIPGQTDFLADGDTISLGMLTGKIIHNPGHTSGAISYLIGLHVFTGDTLFAAGCGRLFEGSPAQLYASLNEKIASLAPESKLYFGHEYTKKNLLFALSVEPDNSDLQTNLEQVRSLLQQGKLTTPTTLVTELKTNPFLRTNSVTILKTVKKSEVPIHSPVDVFRVLRDMKDRF